MKATWENIELTEKANGHSLLDFKRFNWTPEQLVKHGIANIIQPTFINGATYQIGDTRFKYILSTNRFQKIHPPCSEISASMIDYLTMDIELVNMGPAPESYNSCQPTYCGVLLNDRSKPRNKYDREIIPGIHVDVYDVLNAFVTHSPEVDHAVKKLLAPGERGHKGRRQDLEEAIKSIQSALNRMDERGEA